MEAPIVAATTGTRSVLEPEAHDAVRNAWLLVAQRGGDVLGVLAFAALVPRLLGPANFGRFSLLISVAQWFLLLSGLGSTQLTGRFVPVMLLRDQRADARRLFGNLLAVRLLSGPVAAVFCLVLLRLWLRDLSLALLAPVAATVALRSISSVPFAFFLGLNQAARWGAGELARRWSALLLVVAGTAWLGVRGACLGLVLSEIVVLALGLRWSRAHLSLADVRLERDFIAPYLRYNALFFAGNLLFALCHRGGEALVRATGADYTQVGYYGVAAAAHVAAAHAVWQVLMAFLPLLSRLRARGQKDAAGEWASRLLKMHIAGSVVLAVGAQLLGADVLRLVAGPAFVPAAPLLVPVSVTVLAYGVGGVGRLMALALERPRIAFAAAFAQAAALVSLGLPLAARSGAFGVALAVAAATAIHATVLMGAIQRPGRLRLAGPLGALGLGMLFLPLAWVPLSAPLPRALVFVAVVATYVAVLRATRLVTSGELSALRAALRPRPTLSAPGI